MKTRDTLAVVDTHCFHRAYDWWAHGGIASIEELAEKAEAAGLTHVWVVPGTEVSRLAQESFSNRMDSSNWNITGIGKDSFAYLSVRRENKTHEEHIEIGFPEWSRWPWKGDDKPKTLLATLTYLENVLGFPVAYTPAWCSLEYFKRLNASRYHWLSPMNLDLEAQGFSYSNDIAKELHWPKKGQEVVIPEGATHYVRIDVNSAYNAAETGLNVGEGNPIWTDGSCYDGKKPGIWRLSRCEKMDSFFDGQRLPDLVRRWATTDMIEQLRRSGYSVRVEAGWYWETYHQTIRSFADNLWKERVQWRALASKSQAHENVHESIRVFLKALHGKLARPDNAPRFRRRDIWSMVVARSVAMTIYRIEKIYTILGILPISIKADELKYAVRDPHIFDAILDRDKLGGFKLVSVEEIRTD